MKDLEHLNDSNEVRELSENEVMNVSGGFWGHIIAIALAALTAAGCATMPNKGHQD